MASWLNTFYSHSTSKFLYRFWFRIKSYWNALSEFLYMVSQKYVCLFDWFSYDKRTFFFGNMGQFDNSIFYSLKFCVYNICEEFNWPLIRGPKGSFGPVGTYFFLKNAIFIFLWRELDVMRIFTIVVSTHHQPPGYMQYRSNSTLSYHKYHSIVEIWETNQNFHSILTRFKHVTKHLMMSNSNIIR